VAELLMSQRSRGQIRCRKLLAQLPGVREQDRRVDDRPTAPRARRDAQLR
jgi:hypothetical protein